MKNLHTLCKARNDYQTLLGKENSIGSNVEVLFTPPPSSLQLMNGLRFTTQIVVLNMFNGVIM